MSALLGVGWHQEVDRKQADYDAFYEKRACRNAPVDFFPENGAGTAKAIALCNRCPVRQACLDYALDHEENHGVWGGLNAHQRKALQRQRVRS